MRFSNLPFGVPNTSKILSNWSFWNGTFFFESNLASSPLKMGLRLANSAMTHPTAQQSTALL